MKLAENMDGVVIAVIAAALMSGLLTGILPTRDSSDTSAAFDSEVHTVTIVGKHL
jgi:hypothetical protein